MLKRVSHGFFYQENQTHMSERFDFFFSVGSMYVGSATHKKKRMLMALSSSKILDNQPCGNLERQRVKVA